MSLSPSEKRAPESLRDKKTVLINDSKEGERRKTEGDVSMLALRPHTASTFTISRSSDDDFLARRTKFWHLQYGFPLDLTLSLYSPRQN